MVIIFGGIPIMKINFLAIIVCGAAISYAQVGGATSGNAAPTGGAYDPHPLPAGMEAPPPIDQSPKDAFVRDVKLAAKLQKLLPQGPNIQEACDGFRKLGDCVCSIHVAQKLDIAIHELNPRVHAKGEKKKAYKQAENEIPVSN